MVIYLDSKAMISIILWSSRDAVYTAQLTEVELTEVQ